MSQEDNNVKIYFNPDWLGYVLVKALWKYEPGYSEKMFGPGYEYQLVCFLEEKEAIGSLLAHNKKIGYIEQIIDDGFINEFILYEIVLKKSPNTLLPLQRDLFMRVVNYVDIYH